MNLYISENGLELGKNAAHLIAKKINAAINKNGYARIVLSTGASQFDTLQALLMEDVDWTKVTVFHLDEYVDLPVTHKASFRKYLQERFIGKVTLKEAILVNGEGGIEDNIAYLTRRLRELPIDVGVIGIGENAHIAFNDPPADFNTKEAYITVTLNDSCKKQQVGEGWFATVNDVPEKAISMTAYQILKCGCIISAVPKAVKAEAIKNVLGSEKVDSMIPGTILKTHNDFHLFIDADSASKCSEELLKENGATILQK